MSKAFLLILGSSLTSIGPGDTEISDIASYGSDGQPEVQCDADVVSW